LVNAHVEHFAAVVDGRATVGAAPGGTIGACRDENALGAGLESDLADPPAGVLPQCDHSGTVEPVGSRAPRHAERGQGQDGRAGIVGQHAGIACGPARAELRSVEQGGDDQRRAYRTQDVRNVIDLGEVLAYQRDERGSAGLYELDRLAWNLHRFPPADVRVQRSTQVVLIDLFLIQRPSVVLALADTHPVFAGGDGDVNPVAWKLPRSCRTLADPGDQGNHPVLVQERLESVDLAVVHGALREDDGVDVADLVAGRDEHSIHEVQVEPFGRCELEEAEGLLGKAVHRASERTEIRLSHPQRPRKQQIVDPHVVRPAARAAATHLVPPGLDTRTVHPGVA
jgi:hypothetical protein